MRVALDAAEAARIAKFLAVGLLNTVFGYAVFYAALRLTGHTLVSAALSTTAGTLFNFKSTGSLVFGSSDHSLLWRFIGVYIFVFLADSAGLLVLESYGISAALAQASLLPALAALSYVLNRDFVFETRRMDGAA